MAAHLHVSVYEARTCFTVDVPSRSSSHT